MKWLLSFFPLDSARWQELLFFLEGRLKKFIKHVDVSITYDAIYHASAIHKRGILLTADEAYCRKVRGIGNVVRLKDWKQI